MSELAVNHAVTLHAVTYAHPEGILLGMVKNWSRSTEQQHIRIMTDEQPMLEAGVITVSGRLKMAAYVKRTVHIKRGREIQVNKLLFPDERGRQWETTGFVFRSFRTLYGLRMSLGAKCRRRKR
jgi:hypothetical protein